MAEAQVRASTVAVKIETTYATDPTIAAANVIEVAGTPVFNDDFEQKERNVVRNTLSELEMVRGAETVAGEIPFEIKGSGTAGTAPDADPLIECAIGVKNTSTASTTTTGSTTTSVVLTGGGGAGFAVGDAIRVALATPEITWITAKATDTLTVSPALSSAPGSGVAVGAGVHYKLSKTLKSFWAQFWRGDITLETYKGNVVDSLSLDFSVGEIIQASLSFQGKEAAAPVTQTYGLGTPTFDQTLPLMGRNMVLTLAGTSFGMQNLQIEITNEVYRKLDLTTSGTQKILFTRRRITGSFSLIYENKDIEDAFRADTKSEFRIVGGSTAGNILALRIPKQKYTAVPKGEESGYYKYDTSFQAVLTNGEDELTSLSLL